MSAPDPLLLTLIVLVGMLLMLIAGIGKKQLEWRPQPPRWPRHPRRRRREGR